MTLDALKAGGLLVFAALVQVSITSNIQVASGHPDVLLVLVIAIALLRGPAFGAASGFWAGTCRNFRLAWPPWCRMSATSSCATACR